MTSQVANNIPRYSQIKDSYSRNRSSINDTVSRNRTQSTVELLTNSYTLKISFLGDSSVGKTSLILKYCESKFTPQGTGPTLNVEVKEKIIKIDAFTEAKLSIWDTAGAEQYVSFTKNYIRESNGIIIVFDFTNEKSFQNLDMWLDLLNDIVEEGKVVKILVGNKCDLPDAKVTVDMGQKYADLHGMKFISVSAKDGVNIDYLFEVLANDCIKKMQGPQEKNPKEEIPKENEEKIAILNIEDNNKNQKLKKPKGKCC